MFKPVGGSSSSRGGGPMALCDKGDKCKLRNAAKMEAEELLVKAKGVIAKYTKDAEKLLGTLSTGDVLYGRLILSLHW